MSTDDLPTEADPSDALDINGGPSPTAAHVPDTSHAIFLWQHEFEKSLMEQQLQYQQQAVAMELNIKAAALQAAAGAAEVGKLLSQDNAPVVDPVKELSSRRLIKGEEPQPLPLTSDFLNSKVVPTYPIRIEKEGEEKASHLSRYRLTDERRNSRSNERGRKHRSRSRSRSRKGRRRHGRRSRSKERKRHRSRSRSTERRRYKSRSRSTERRRYKSRSRSRSKERKNHRSRSRIRERQRHEKRSRSRSRRSRSMERGRRRSHEFRSPNKGSDQDKSRVPGSWDSWSRSSRRSKQDSRTESKLGNSKFSSHGEIFTPGNANPFSTGKLFENTKTVDKTGKTSWGPICTDRFHGRESESRGDIADAHGHGEAF